MSFYKELNHVGIMNAVYNATMSTFSIDKGQLWLWTSDPEHVDIQRLLKRVVSEGKVVSVKRWDYIGDGGNQDGIQRITSTDKNACFTDYSITACPVWDSFGIEVIGVVMLMITGALMVCRDVSQYIHRVQRMQDLLEEYTSATRASATLFNMNLVTVGKPAPTTLSSPYGFSLAVTIDSSGALRSSTYPVNMFTRGFALCSTHDILRLPVDAHGNRHVIQVTAASQPHYESNHFDKWMGRDVVAGDWEKIKYDLHNAFSRKETLTAYYSTTHAQSLQFVNTLETVISSAAQNSVAINGTLPSKQQQPMAVAMPDASIRKEIALFLWQFCSTDLKIHLDKVFALFSPYDPKATGCVDPADFEYVVKAWGVHLNHHVSLLTGFYYSAVAMDGDKTSSNNIHTW
ncbi:hypothetical protein AaE_003196 [Aphanomyces astaci]|uniref:EF-hand domain-containing protein n=1 Tax=Aphanomyces astaci TaxID=112090 RepID=A0A6A5ALN8_APHAT|nr:hypothetical protein AaE_003196 [Aphanomyces astaci]